MTGWIADARAIEVPRVAAELGLTFRRGHLYPCPSCNESTRSSSDRRPGPVFLTQAQRKWRCHRCDAHGDGIDLVRAVLGGDWPELRAWFAARGWCAPADDGPVVARVVPQGPQVLPEAFRPPPPADEVAELWARCSRVADDDEVVGWLRSRALDVALVEDRDLARVLPHEGPLPSWANHWRGPIHVCPVVVPLYGPTGALVGLRGRRIDSETPKSVATKGRRAVGGYADPTARAVLEVGGRPSWWSGDLVIVAEGEPDYLTWATWVGMSESAPAVLGFSGSGGWSSEVAARIPDGVRVVVRAHADKAGKRYAADIARDLAGRCRVRVLEGAA